MKKKLTQTICDICIDKRICTEWHRYYRNSKNILIWPIISVIWVQLPHVRHVDVMIINENTTPTFEITSFRRTLTSVFFVNHFSSSSSQSLKPTYFPGLRRISSRGRLFRIKCWAQFEAAVSFVDRFTSNCNATLRRSENKDYGKTPV